MMNKTIHLLDGFLLSCRTAAPWFLKHLLNCWTAKAALNGSKWRFTNSSAASLGGAISFAPHWQQRLQMICKLKQKKKKKALFCFTGVLSVVPHWQWRLQIIYKLKTKEEEEETTLLLCQGASFAPDW
jgi:hypothetical protein